MDELPESPVYDVDTDSASDPGEDSDKAEPIFLAEPRNEIMFEGFLPDHFVEYFSVPRVAPYVRALGGQAITSLDITASGAQQRDFTNPADREFALTLLHERQVRFIGLTPPCTMFSKLTQLWNLKKLPEEVKRQKLGEAEELFDFAILVARTQHARGGYFFLEQPHGASSWDLLKHRLKDEPIAGRRPTFQVRFDQCRYGLVSPRGEPIKKSTRFWTNSLKIVQEFEHKKCVCSVSHRVVQGSQDGHQISTWAQNFPRPLCEAIARCVMDQ